MLVFSDVQETKTLNPKATQSIACLSVLLKSEPHMPSFKDWGFESSGSWGLGNEIYRAHGGFLGLACLGSAGLRLVLRIGFRLYMCELCGSGSSRKYTIRNIQNAFHSAVPARHLPRRRGSAYRWRMWRISVALPLSFE